MNDEQRPVIGIYIYVDHFGLVDYEFFYFDLDGCIERDRFFIFLFFLFSV